MHTYQPINCDLHDYLEIACMHHYQLSVELLDGNSFIAKALTTRTSAQKEEFFCMERDDKEEEIRLDQLLAITPLGQQVSFGRIVLAENACTCESKSS